MATPDEVLEFFRLLYGEAEGKLHTAVGVGGAWNDQNVYKFDQFMQSVFAYPGEAELCAKELLRAADVGADVYAAVNLMHADKRAQGAAVARWNVHSDVDDGRFDEARVKAIGGCAVASGTPGNAHVYVGLTEPVPAHVHRALCIALSKYLGAKDSKISDNDLLRVPGTFNFKEAALGGERRGVEWLIRPGPRVDPAALAGLLGVNIAAAADFTTTPRTSTPSSATGIPVDLDRYPSVQKELDDNSGDRSADTFRVIAACRRAKLTLDECRWVVRTRTDLAARLDERRDDDLLAVWLKIEADELAFDRLVAPAASRSVDGPEVLDRVARWFRRFVCFTADADADLVTLWAAHTHLARELRISPRLHIDSITFGSGKTTLLEHLKALCVNGLLTVGTSPAVIPRLVSMRMTTVLFDEVDRVLAPGKEGVSDLIAIINSGHRWGNVRTVLVPAPGGDWVPQELSTYSAVALAGNSPQLPDDTLSRSLRVLLMPDNNGEAEDTDWPLIEDECKQLAVDLAAWADSVRGTITISGVKVPGARGRELERWRTLKAVAYAAGGHWEKIVDKLIEHGLAEAQALKEAGITRVPAKLQLLHDLHLTWNGQPEFMATTTLCERLIAENRPYWGETATRTELSPQRLGKMIADATKQLSAQEKSQRPDSHGPRGYFRSQFNPTWVRLGLPLYPDHSADSAQSDHRPDPSTPSAPSDPVAYRGGEGG